MENRSGIVRKKAVLALSLIVLSLALPLPSSGYLKGDVDSDNKITLNEALNALQVASGVRSPLSSKTINVPGDIPTIQQAIDAAAEGDTISIAAGTYNEVLLIEKNRITLQGAGKESTIIDGGGLDTIVIQGGSGVAIKALKVQNGKNGINGRRGTALEVHDVIVQDCSGNGIWMYENATAQIADTTVLRGNIGIVISRNSSAVFSGSVFTANNGLDGFYINSTSSCLFNNAAITTKDNGRWGIWVGASSSLSSGASGVTVQNNTSDGVTISGGSCFSIESGTWLVENNTQRGVVAAGASWIYLHTTGTLTSRLNKKYGIDVVDNSNAEMKGIVLLEDNTSVGLEILISSSVTVLEPGSITVRGTHGDLGIGILVQDVSSLWSWNGIFLVENNTGSYGDGIIAARNSDLALMGTTSSVKVRNNGRWGILIDQHSRGRFDAGMEITGNASDGICAAGNSGFVANSITVQGNSGWGVAADDGSTVKVSNSTITGNAKKDVYLAFGSRATLTGNTIGVVPITGDATSLCRGTGCP